MPQKILLVQTAFIGDLILSTPLLKELRRLYPEARIDLLCRKPLAELMLGLGLVDHAMEWNKKDKAGFKAVVARLKNEDYDLVYCPHPSFRSALLTKQTGASRRVGFKKWWNPWAFTHRVERPTDLPEALRQMSLLGPEHPALAENLRLYQESQLKRNPNHLDHAGERDETGRVPDWASLSCRSWFDQRQGERSELLKSLGLEVPTPEKPWAAIGPGSVWGTKRYPRSSYHEVARKLAGLGYQVIALGAPNEREDCEAVVQGIESARVIAGQTSLLQSAHLLYLAEVLFTNDCGAMHLASLTETPTLSVFGPTVLSFGYRPWQNRAIVIQNKELACRPCHHHGPPTCPLGHHECMRSIAPEELLAARFNLGLER